MLDHWHIMKAAKAQAQLIKLLSTELDSAFTMLRSAEVDTASDLDSRIAVLAKLRSTLRMLRRFEGHVEDAGIAGRIKARAVELESALRALHKMANSPMNEDQIPRACDSHQTQGLPDLVVGRRAAPGQNDGLGSDYAVPAEYRNLSRPAGRRPYRRNG
jgi:hypothetical protein